MSEEQFWGCTPRKFYAMKAYREKRVIAIINGIKHGIEVPEEMKPKPKGLYVDQIGL